MNPSDDAPAAGLAGLPPYLESIMARLPLGEPSTPSYEFPTPNLWRSPWFYRRSGETDNAYYPF